MPVFTDQTGRKIILDSTPERIISLVPSQTELLADLGLGKEVVGITKFCIHPENWFRTKTRVGGTKQVQVDRIHQLKPDLIIANKEENVKEQVEELAKHYPVWVSDINNLEDSYEMITQIGAITGKDHQAELICSTIKTEFYQLSEKKNSRRKIRTAYLIWKEPYMTIGSDTFIHCMLAEAGFENVFANHTRYPEVTVEDLQMADCQVLFLSSEPYPFGQKHINELQSLFPATRIILVDGEMFSWYGSRLQFAPAYFVSLYELFK